MMHVIDSVVVICERMIERYHWGGLMVLVVVREGDSRTPIVLDNVAVYDARCDLIHVLER